LSASALPMRLRARPCPRPSAVALRGIIGRQSSGFRLLWAVERGERPRAITAVGADRLTRAESSSMGPGSEARRRSASAPSGVRSERTPRFDRLLRKNGHHRPAARAAAAAIPGQGRRSSAASGTQGGDRCGPRHQGEGDRGAPAGYDQKQPAPEALSAASTRPRRAPSPRACPATGQAAGAEDRDERSAGPKGGPNRRIPGRPHSEA